MESTFELAKQSDSTIIILFIVVVIALVFLIPFLKTISSIKRSNKKQEYEREDRFIQVIERNTEVNTALKTIIENDKKQCEICRREQYAMFNKVFDNQEVVNLKLTEISTTLGIENKNKYKREELQ